MPRDLSFISGHIRMSLWFNESKILSQPFFYPHSVSKIYIQIITVWVATHSLHIVFHGVQQQCVTVSIRASLTTATWRCRKNFSQWERSVHNLPEKSWTMNTFTKAYSLNFSSTMNWLWFVKKEKHDFISTWLCSSWMALNLYPSYACVF